MKFLLPDCLMITAQSFLLNANRITLARYIIHPLSAGPYSLPFRDYLQSQLNFIKMVHTQRGKSSRLYQNLFARCVGYNTYMYATKAKPPSVFFWPGSEFSAEITNDVQQMVKHQSAQPKLPIMQPDLPRRPWRKACILRHFRI